MTMWINTVEDTGKCQPFMDLVLRQYGRGFRCDLYWSWNIELSSCEATVKQWLRETEVAPSGRNVPGSCSSSYRSSPVILVAIATLPFKFRKFHEQDYSGVKDLMKKKKKKELANSAPGGSCTFLEDFSPQTNHNIKGLWRLVVGWCKHNCGFGLWILNHYN